MTKGIHKKDDDAEMLAGVPASSLPKRPPLGIPVILSFQADRRRYLGLEDASDPVEGFESIGSLAVRIVGQFELPRIVCRSMAWEEGTPTGTEEDH